jgi:hypothetical protein
VLAAGVGWARRIRRVRTQGVERGAGGRPIPRMLAWSHAWARWAVAGLCVVQHAVRCVALRCAARRIRVATRRRCRALRRRGLFGACTWRVVARRTCAAVTSAGAGPSRCALCGRGRVVRACLGRDGSQEPIAHRQPRLRARLARGLRAASVGVRRRYSGYGERRCSGRGWKRTRLRRRSSDGRVLQRHRSGKACAVSPPLIHTSRPARTQTSRHARSGTHTRTQAQTRARTQAHACAHACMHSYTSNHRPPTSTRTHIHAHTHIERERDTHTRTHTHTHTHTHTRTRTHTITPDRAPRAHAPRQQARSAARARRRPSAPYPCRLGSAAPSRYCGCRAASLRPRPRRRPARLPARERERRHRTASCGPQQHGIRGWRLGTKRCALA